MPNVFNYKIKEVKSCDKNEEETMKTISHRLQFSGSAKFMASLLSNLAGNLVEGIHKIKCKYGHDNKKCEKCEIKFKDFEFCLEYTNVKDYLILYKQLCGNKSYQNKFDEILKKIFAKTCKYSNHDAISFFCSCKRVLIHMNTWMQKFSETLPEREDSYSHLNIEDITDVDYMHTK